MIANALTAMLGADSSNLRVRIAQARGVVNIAASGETSWHGFAIAIVEGLRRRGVPLAVRTILPLRTEEYPTRAKRPLNSRLDLTRLRDVFDLTTPPWREVLEEELELLGREMRHA
jgi:dTDP-4-dehydrorhamnose reductase